MDVAALNFGTWVENELQKRDRRGRPTRTLEELLRQPDANARAQGGQGAGGRRRPAPRAESEFKSPVLMGVPIRKVRPNKDGTW